MKHSSNQHFTEWKGLQIKTFETGHVCLTVQGDSMVRLNGSVLFDSVETLFETLRKVTSETDTCCEHLTGCSLEPVGALNLSKHTTHKPVDTIDGLVLLHAEYLI